MRDNFICSDSCRSEHHKKTRKFWWETGAEANKLQTFLIFSAEFHHFKELVIKALSTLEESKKKRFEQVNIVIKIMSYV